MSSIFKKSAIALVVLGFAGVSYAGSMPYAGTVNGVFIGGEGLYLQPRNGDLDFVTSYPVRTNDAVYTQAIRPGYSWGFRLFGGLKFCGNDDAVVSWQRLHTYYNGSIATPNSLVPGVPAFTQPRWLTEAPWKNINSRVTFNYDDVYGVFGHTIDLRAWSFRFGSGIEWARIDSDLTVHATFFSPTLPEPFGYTAKSHWNGVGPRLEADMAYHMPYNFSVFANSNMALFISSRSVSLNTVNNTDGEFHSVTFSNRLIVVPKFGMRLGVAYSYVFGPVGGEGAAGADPTTLTAAAGWQVESYIHPIERPNTGNNGGGLLRTASIGQQNTNTKVSNFGDQGLFLGLKLSMDW